MKKILSSLLSKTLAMAMILSLTLSGCSGSLFLPIVEEYEENIPTIPTALELSAEAGIVTESYNGFSYLYTNSETVTLSITVPSQSDTWSEIAIWENDAIFDEGDAQVYPIDFDGALTTDISYTLSGSSEEEYTVNARLQNDNGDETDTVSIIIVLDKTAPTFSLSINDSTSDTSTPSTQVELEFYNKSVDDFYQMKVWRNDEDEPSGFESFQETVDDLEIDNSGDTFLYYAKVRDKSGNVSQTVSSPSISFNNDIPSFSYTINGSSSAEIYTGANELTIQITDYYSPQGLNQPEDIAVWDNTGDEASAEWITLNSIGQCTHELPDIDSEYTLSIQVRELRSTGTYNYSETSTASITYDSTSPVLESFTINGLVAPEVTNDPELVLTVSVADDMTPEDELEVKLWSGLESDESADSTYINLSELPQIDLSGQSDSTYTYWVRVRDNCGNESAATSCSVEYDTTAPVITSLLCREGSFVQTQLITLQVGVYGDDASDIKVWTGSTEPDDSYYEAWDGNDYPFTLPTTDGSYQVYAKVRDTAGNESDSSSLTVTLDSERPNLSFLINGGDSETNSASVTLTVTTESDVTGIKYWNTTKPDEYTPYTPGDSISHTLDSPFNGASSTVYMQVQDSAGYESDVVSDGIFFDNQIETPEIHIAEGTVTASETLTLTLNADTDVTHMMLWGSDSTQPDEFESFESSRTYTLSSPVNSTEYFIYLIVRDDAGNLSSTAQSSIVYNDLAPDVTVTVNSGVHAFLSETLDIDLSATTASGSITDMQIWVLREGDDYYEPTEWVSYNALNNSYDLPSEGTYTVYARVRNSAELVSDISSVEIIYDNTPPQFTSTSLVISGETTDFWTNEGNVDLTFTSVTDNIEVYEVKIWEGGSEPGDSSYESYGSYLSTRSLTTERTYEYHARFRDEAGNVSTVLDGPEMTLDTTDPVVNLTLADGIESPTNASSVTLQFNGSDDSDLEYQFWLNGETEPVYAAYVSERTDNLTARGDGTYTYWVRLRDQAGNESSDSLTLAYDGTIPTLTLTLDSQDLTNDRIIELSLASDDGYEMDVWDNTETVHSYSSYSSTTTHTISSSNPDGDYTIYAQVRDEAGNESPQSSVAVTLDRTPPDLTGFTINDSTSPDDTTDSTLDLEIESDGTAAEMKIWLGTDEPSDSSYETYIASSTYELPSDGDYRVNIRLRDEAGNISSSLYRLITLDSTGPDLSLTITETSPTNNQTIDLLLTSADAVDMASWNNSATLPGGTVFTGFNTSTTHDLPSTDGDHTVYVMTRDYLGNESIIRSHTITLDTTPPVLNGLTINDSSNPQDTTNPVLDLDIDDDGTSYEMKIWTGTEDEEPDDSTYEPYSAASSYTLTSSGDYDFFVRLRDEAGNPSANAASCSITYDTTGPDISFTIDEVSPTNSRLINLNITSASATEMSIWDSSYSAQPGYETFSSTATHSLPDSDGEYTVYVMTRDAAGNPSVTAQQTMTLDREDPVITGFTINDSAAPDDTTNPVLDLDITATGSPYSMKIWTGTVENEPDDTNYETFNSISTLTLSEDGTYTVYVLLRDEAGNETDTPASCTVSYDGTPPTCTFTITDGEATPDLPIVLNISPNDPDDVQSMKIWTGDNEPTEYDIDFSEIDNTAYTYNLEEVSGQGTYRVYIRLRDEIGNESPSAVYQDIIYDTSDPSIDTTVSIDETSPTMQELVNLTYDVSDTYSSTYVRFSNNDITYSDWEAADGTHENWNLVSGYGGSTGDGTKTVYMQVRDAAYHQIAGGSDSIEYDSTAPSIDSFTLEDTGSPVSNASSGSYDITLSAAGSPSWIKIWDSGTSEGEVAYRAYTAADSATAAYTYTVSGGRDDGTYMLYAKVYDAAYNESDYTTDGSTASIIYDATAPNLSSFMINNSSDPDDTGNTTLTIDFSASDDVNIWGMKLWHGTIEPTLFTNPYSTSTTYTGLAGENDGTYTINARLCDNAGNESDIFSLPITLDTQIYLYSMNLRDEEGDAPGTTTLDGDFYVSLVVESEPSLEMQVWVTLDAATVFNSGYIDIQNNLPVDISSYGTGTYIVHAQIRDEANNEATEITSTITY